MKPSKPLFLLTSSLACLSLGVSLALAGSHDDKDGRTHHNKRIEKMDSDKDQLVSREEFLQFHTSMFDKIDQNRDGRLSSDEFRAFHKKHHDDGDKHDRDHRRDKDD